MSNSFENDILRITEEVMTDGTIEKIMRDKITEGFERAIDSSFHYGELSRAIDGRVKEALVPYIERYDMSQYVIKLDEVLSQIVEQTALVDNRRILDNFKNLMIEPVEKTVTLKQVFDRYCKYVADNASTENLEIIDGSYEYVYPSAEIIEEEIHYSRHFHYATLVLTTEDQEDLSFQVRLSKWTEKIKDGYEFRYDANPELTSLSTMNDFEVYLCALSRSGVVITWESRTIDYPVELNKEPELDYV